MSEDLDAAWIERMRLVMENEKRALEIFADGAPSNHLARNVMLSGDDITKFIELLAEAEGVAV